MLLRKRSIISLTLSLAFLASACGPNAESAIATSVALTVQAQNAFTPTLAPVTATPLPGLTAVPTLTSIAQPTSATGGKSYIECAHASFVSETPPDGTIYLPATTFTKKWYIQNDSTCVWDTTYKIVFWDGNVMGGGYVYNFPQSVLPGDTVEIPLVLITPDAVGLHRGDWKFQTPDGITFGVGQYGDPVYVEVEVSTEVKPGYGITSVTYRLERSPFSGCATNVLYTAYATISVSGRVTVKVHWEHSDGGATSNITLEFTEAGSKETSDTWAFHLGSSTGDKWLELVSSSPTKQRFGKQTFSYLCQ